MATTAARAGSPARAGVPAPLPDAPAPDRSGRSGAGGGPGAAARAVVLLVAALAVLASVAAVVVIGLDGAWSLPGAQDVPVDATIGLVYAVVGAAVALARHGSRPLGLVMLGAGVAGALTVLSAAVAVTATQVTPTVLVAVWLQAWLWVPATAPLVTLVPLLYPDGRPPSRRWRPAVWAAGLGTVLVAAGVSAFPEPFEGRLTLDRPLTDEAVARLLVPVGAVLLVAAALAAVASVVVRLVRSQGLVRRQVLVLAVAFALLLAHTLSVSRIPSPWDVATQAVAACLVPLAIGVAVTRHRLYDLDTAVCRALAGLSLAVCLAGVYATLVALAQPVLAGEPALVTALAAGVTGLLVHPLAVRLSRGVDRLFYGERADPGAVLGAMSRRLGAGLDVTEVPQAVCDTVVDTLRLGAARLELAGGPAGGEPTVAATAPAGTEGTPAPRQAAVELAVALEHRGEHVGSLVVAPRPGERAISPRDRELVVGLAGLVAPSVAAVRLHRQLQGSREALVAAREEERRRVRRELHDGVGAALAGVRLQLDTARAALADRPEAGMLAAAGAGVEEAIADVRAVSDDLRPPALDELGLTGALHVLGTRLSTERMRVHVDVPPLGRLPAATEVAAYRVAAEALANAARHSGASDVALRVAPSGSRLVLTVTDDGRGPGAGTRDGGQGVPSMRRRAEELGGSCELRPAAGGGTVVEVVLPLVGA